MTIFILLFVLHGVLSGLCSFTGKIGAVLSWMSMIATWVLIILTFFFAPAWWYGLVIAGLYFLVPMLLPRINPEAMSDSAKLLSGIFSYVNIAIVPILYILLFV